MKATHKGSCQCCGRLQMLPKGILSKHGYTVDYGYFNGTCRGAGYLPFEQSCDQVERYIREAQAALLDMSTSIETTYANVKLAWVHEYVKSENRFAKSGYVWRQVEIIATEVKYEASSWTDYNGKPAGHPAGSYFKFHYVGLDGANHEVSVYGGMKSTEEVCRERNAEYVKLVLEPRLVQMIKYITWQTKRVQSWQPKPLTEVK